MGDDSVLEKALSDMVEVNEVEVDDQDFRIVI